MATDGQFTYHHGDRWNHADWEVCYPDSVEVICLCFSETEARVITEALNAAKEHSNNRELQGLHQ
jgi:hypothetical protein